MMEHSDRRSGETLPLPLPPFRGLVGTDYSNSEADFPESVTPPVSAPNVVVVLLDDVGFGQPSAFGGSIHMPALDRVSGNGLRYNRFHTTSMCSPTRAALLTGRNHHAVHTGNIMEYATGFPGYDGVLPDSAATVAEVLRQNGYSTAAVGKWHNIPEYETSVAGPFDRWPTGQGFDYFYGFLGGEASQWNPPLYENTSATEKPAGQPDWHFSSAIADQSIEWMHNQKAAAPDKPFFLYYAPGAAHAPHHVAPEWADKYKGKFDHGWDREREIVFERQKAMGVIPADTELTPRPEEIPAWDDCSADEKRLYTRMQEVYAGFLEHADTQFDRVLDAIEVLEQLDNTLVIYIAGDNGPSAEGSFTGTLNSMKTLQGFPDDVATMLESIDEIGGPDHENHYPVGWCWAGSSPLQWMKQIASHFGATRNGMALSWPDRIRDIGAMRTQFHHVIDILPTILEVAGIAAPHTVNGVAQQPMDGASMAYSFDDPQAPGRRRTQYFEMFGHRAIYHDGWVAGARHSRMPWVRTGSNVEFDKDTWELYDIENDFSQAKDLVASEPDRLRRMQELFTLEAARNGVFPLDDRSGARFAPTERGNRTRFVCPAGTARLPESAAPNVKNRSHSIQVNLSEPLGNSEGVLLAMGGVAGGYSLFIQAGCVSYDYNFFREHTVITSEAPICESASCIELRFHSDSADPGSGGIGRLYVDGVEVGSGRVNRTVPYRYCVGGTLDVGRDPVTAVSPKYQSPFPFTGSIRNVVVDISGSAVADPKTLHELAQSIQ
ncbi:arylsulfatase [Rhodococcus sp. IEGM 1379]|uniref:arylsulfatase n=1 Tax=Rhodococcus sp. IEGM 1379 TaxID=3047086 RepID=UPI0024B7C63E|nr:arylsulfatase [Rhodococcus sp. IEGM 1379]MDI9915375.1 arylsulfatase [Rhodococcus sp. IEGM 1379]